MGVLIVDDAPDNRAPLKAILERAGYNEVQTAASAFEAFTLLGMMNPAGGDRGIDVILMDVMMPGMDGIEACRRIKTVASLRDIPVIMVTSHTESRDVEAAFNAGAMDFIAKPVNVIELLARLRSALSLKREMDVRKRREQDLLHVTRQLQEANQKLQRLSSLDGLTEIPNRRSFDEFLDRSWRYGIRKHASLSLILVDIDHFKDYNDTYGHQLGDECLKRVAQSVSATLQRPTDLVARYGGEEFAMLLPDTDAGGALVVGESLRSHIEALGLVHERSPAYGRVTISGGAATLVPEIDVSPQILVAAADRALYRAKREGRNRIRIADPIPSAGRSEAVPAHGGPHRRHDTTVGKPEEN